MDAPDDKRAPGSDRAAGRAGFAAHGEKTVVPDVSGMNRIGGGEYAGYPRQILDVYFSVGRCTGQFLEFRFQTGRMLVFEGGEQQEVRMQQFKTPLGFHNAAFPQQNDLSAHPQRRHNAGPFFQCGVHSISLSTASVHTRPGTVDMENEDGQGVAN